MNSRLLLQRLNIKQYNLNFSVPSLLQLQSIFLYSYSFSLSIENIAPFGTDNFSISKLFAAFYFVSILPKFKNIFNSNMSRYFFWPIALFYIWLTIVSIVNVNLYSSKYFAADIFLNILIFYAIADHARKDYMALDKAMFAFAIGTIFVSGLVFLEIGKVINQDCRVTFLQAGPNEIGIKLTTGLFIIITMIIQDTLLLGIKRFYLIPFLPLISLFLFETGSRTAYAVLSMEYLVLFILLVANHKNKIKAILTALFIAIVILSPLMFFSSPCKPDVSKELDVAQKTIIPREHEPTREFASIIELIRSRFSKDVEIGYLNLGGRSSLWRGFLSIISKNIILGYGLSGYELQSFMYFGVVENPHNLIIEVLLYTGLIGLIIYLFFLYRIFNASYNICMRLNKYLPLVLLPTFIGFALSLQGLSEKICWLVLAYTVGTILCRGKEYKTFFRSLKKRQTLQ